MTANGYRVSFWGVEKVLELDSSYGAQLCEYYKTTELYTFGIYFSINVIVCELYIYYISFSKDLKTEKVSTLPVSSSCFPLFPLLGIDSRAPNRSGQLLKDFNIVSGADSCLVTE